MSRGRVGLEWDQTSELWRCLAEPLRDPNEHPEPFSPLDIHPFYRHDRGDYYDGPDLGAWSKIAASGVQIHKIDVGKLQHV